MKCKPPTARSLAAKAATGLALSPVRAYQWFVSPFLGCNCRFIPSCSHYAQESLAKHGLLKGGLLTARRLLRCNPFGASGYDPVPPCGGSCHSVTHQP
jgi:putative membrane protein insertion efficiency factor